MAVAAVGLLFASFTTDPSGLLTLLIVLLFYLLGPVYFLLCWYCWGKTPGMRAVNAELVDRRTLGRPVWWRLLLRYAVFSALFVVLDGYAFILLAIWMWVDKRRQGPHDRLAGTLVILRVAAKPVAETPAEAGASSDSPIPVA